MTKRVIFTLHEQQVMHGGMAEEGEERSSEYCQRVNFLVILPPEDNYMRPSYYPSVVMHDQSDYFQKQ